MKYDNTCLGFANIKIKFSNWEMTNVVGPENIVRSTIDIKFNIIFVWDYEKGELDNLNTTSRYVC